MSIRLALRDFLTRLGPLTAIVGPRIFPVIAPQVGGDVPRVRYLRTSDQRERSLGPADPNTGGMARFLLCCEGLSDTDDAAAIEDAIRGTLATSPPTPGLDGYTGLMGPKGNQYYVTCRVDDARDEAEQPQHGEDTWTERVELDVTINYEPTGG